MVRISPQRGRVLTPLWKVDAKDPKKSLSSWRLVRSSKSAKGKRNARPIKKYLINIM
jgi:hypothetical protein